MAKSKRTSRKVKLTNAFIEKKAIWDATGAATSATLYSDTVTPGLSLKVTPNGWKSFVFRYVNAEGQAVAGAYPLNPNGSVADIAGICNVQGNVVGLMPHPEDHLLPIQNPRRRNDQLGLALFQAFVAAA